ncbi:nuclear transport factor 2-like [Myripristis murdjan]|uniref:NTF2-related export protein n=1 Tax=Myripristis murdjan TaxID=586833 RepID=A0A667X4J5_9TELE|nr:nuclear transport factor 2-like [Myripristis murdjan]
MNVQKPFWQEIGESFIQVYYRQFDTTDRRCMAELYSDKAFMTWEGTSYAGREEIIGKLTALPFKSIEHVVTVQDIQPTVDSCILATVIGQLKADNDHVMGFHQMFLLKHHGQDRWACTNDIFRLALHNIAA